MQSNSWVITLPDGRIFEVFRKDNADKARKQGWQVETVMDYLGRVNEEIKNRAQQS